MKWAAPDDVLRNDVALCASAVLRNDVALCANDTFRVNGRTRVAIFREIACNFPKFYTVLITQMRLPLSWAIFWYFRSKILKKLKNFEKIPKISEFVTLL